MTLEEYADKYGVNMDDLADFLSRRLEYVDGYRKEQLLKALQPDEKSAAHSNMLNLVEEASANMEVARKLRESVIGKEGTILGTVGDVQKALLAADRCLETSAKRFAAIYSVASQQALEEAVTETIAGMDPVTYQNFIEKLESKLKTIR
jgi:hypothetical protein